MLRDLRFWGFAAALLIALPAGRPDLALAQPGTVRLQKSTTATQSVVPGSATSVTCLAANQSRLGATIYNDSSAVLRVALGTAASTSAFTVRMVPDAYFEVPFFYTGSLHCIWDSATGNARVTELTP